jgi:Zn ribbon nucleic-acid-binding protein
MPMNRVQFQPGLSMFEFLQRYGSEEKCEAAVEAARWPQGFACPRCRGTAAYAFRRGRQPYRECVGCGYQCSLIAGTVFQASKLPLSRWFMAMQLLSQAKNNVAALELRRQLGVSYPTAWLMKHKIMEAMRLREEGRQLHGRVEMDDAYLGGERTGGKPGRGSENKVPFVLAVQTIGVSAKPHLVCTTQLPFRKSAIAEFCAEHLVRPLTVVSDGLACFTAAADAGVHQRIVTGGGKASAKHPEFQAVNIMLGNLKTAFTGTYHAFKFHKYTQRYLAEFQFRFNRRYRMHEMLPRMLSALIAAPARNTALIRAPDVPC